MGCGASSDANVRDPAAAEGGDNNEPIDEEVAMEFQQEKLDKAGNLVNKYETNEKKPEADTGLFEVMDQDDTESFMAVRPWIGALKAPSNPPQNHPEAPSQRLQLEYVNGYRCEDSRSNLFYTSHNSEIVFFTAAVGIVQNITSNKQSFFGAGVVGEVDGHNDDIESMDIDPTRKIAVTGQRGPNPLVLVWDIATKEIKARISLGRGNRAAKCAKFSKDGQYVFITDEHNDHNMHVIDWRSQTKLGIQKTGGEPIMDIDTGKGSYAAVTAGKRGLIFFTFQGGMLGSEKCLFGSTGMTDMLSVRFTEDGNRCVSGALNGNIYIWGGRQAEKVLRVHDGAVQTISIVSGLLFTSGTKDRVLKVYDGETFAQKESHQLGYHARAIDYKDGKILVGTRGGTIVEIVNGQQNSIMIGHSTGETWGLDIDSNTGLIATSGDDNKVIIFDPKTNKTILTTVVNSVAGMKKKIGGASTLSMYPPNQCARAVAVNPKNGQVAIASNDGDLSIRASLQDLETKIFESKISREWIEVLTFSPDGSRLAVGSHDNHIYIYDTSDYTRVADCNKHQSFITSVDWSRDGQFLQSNCGAYEYLFFNASSGQQITGGASQFRDEKWATFSCKLGWPVQGVFPPATDGSHVNGVSRSNSQALFAVGDDWGFVNLYKNPCLKGNKAVSFRAHSSHVVRVRFDKDDKYVYSVGGYDRTLMKWKVV